VDVDIGQLDAAHHRPFQANSAELGVAQVDGAKLRAAEVDALESGPLEISIKELRHTHDATSGASSDWMERLALSTALFLHPQ
jgi:hypothetical protein